MRHELYETLYIYNSLHRIGNRISNNSDVKLFNNVIYIILIIALMIAVCYFLIPFYILYFYWTSEPIQSSNNEEFLDNYKFFKIMIPILCFIALSFLVLIKLISLIHAVFIFVGLVDLFFIYWVFEERIIKFFKL